MTINTIVAFSFFAGACFGTWITPVIVRKWFNKPFSDRSLRGDQFLSGHKYLAMHAVCQAAKEAVENEYKQVKEANAFCVMTTHTNPNIEKLREPVRRLFE